MYSYDDDMAILKYIIKNDYHGKVSGISLWEEMEELGVRKEGQLRGLLSGRRWKD